MLLSEVWLDEFQICIIRKHISIILHEINVIIVTHATTFVHCFRVLFFLGHIIKAFQNNFAFIISTETCFWLKRVSDRTLAVFSSLETRFNIHNQIAIRNAFRNAFLELSRLLSISQWVRLSPFPRVESRFNTHNQNAFANAFLELLRLSSISQNHDYEYTVRPRKTDPWNKGMLWPSAGMAGLYDCSHTFIVKYDHYAFEWYTVEIPPIMHHWAALFSKLNVKIHLFHFKEGR